MLLLLLSGSDANWVDTNSPILFGRHSSAMEHDVRLSQELLSAWVDLVRSKEDKMNRLVFAIAVAMLLRPFAERPRPHPLRRFRPRSPTTPTMLFKHITIIGVTIRTAGMDIITVIDTIGMDIDSDCVDRYDGRAICLASDHFANVCYGP